ncbi:unnamed protein product [Rotaria sp. Silwood2]|nr:unnamed protein product [Rotaria sp. Silwood2]
MLKVLNTYDHDLSLRWALCGRLNSPYLYLRKFIIALEFSGSGYVWIPYSFIMIGINYTSVNEAMRYILLFTGLMFDVAVIGTAKWFVRRQRPIINHDDVLSIGPDKYSFPSGHTSRAVFLLFYFINTSFFQNIRGSVIISWLSTVVASRILLGRHYISDVLAGVLFGIFECAAVVRLTPFEYPGAKDQGAEPHSKTGYTKLVKKLSQMFQQEAKQAGKEKLLLTCATAAARHRIEAGYEVEEVCKYFDFVSVMTYDYHGSWEGKTGHNSPLYGMRNERKKFREWNIKGSMNVWVELGCPKEKLNIGLSAYGRAFSLLRDPGITNSKPMRKKKTSIGLKAGAAEAGKYTREAGVLSYYEICESIQKNPNNRVFWHREMSVPYVSSETLWIGYDNIRSVTLKMQFLKEHGYGGVIIWSLDLDDKTGEICNEGPFPIFNAAKNELLIVPDHLSNINKKCLDDNDTLSIEQLFSQSTTIKGINLSKIQDFLNFY